MPGSMLHSHRHAVTRLIWPGQDIQALHHAKILMRQGMAMRNKTAGCDGIEVDAKGNRPDRVRIDIYIGRGISWLRLRTRHDHGVVPFWRGQGRAVDLG